MAIVVDLVLVWIVGNLLVWEIFGFLEREFADLVPIIQLGMWVSVAANAVYIVDDRSVHSRVARLVVDAVNLYVTLQIFAVFPFDFSAHGFEWGLVLRGLLLIALIATLIGAVAHAAQIVNRGSRDGGVGRRSGVAFR